MARLTKGRAWLRRENLPWVLVGALGVLLLALAVPQLLDRFDDTGSAAPLPKPRPSSTSSSSAAAAQQSAAAVPNAGPGPKQQGSYSKVHPTATKFRPNGTKLASCGNDPSCYEQAFGNLTYYEGPHAAFKVFDRYMKTNSTLAGDCHRTAHFMGAAALLRFHRDVPKAFAAGSPSCWSGYYHGILERALANISTTPGLIRVARRICTDPGIRKTVWLFYQCVHGLGHGLMIYTGYNLPFALKVCDKLQTPWTQSSCEGGVFMENLVSSYGVPSPWLKKNDGVYPCQVVAERHKNYCYLMVTSRINQLNGYDWAKTAATCERVEPRWVSYCFTSMGRDASGQTTENPQKVLDICRQAKRHWTDCFYGAARDFTAVFAGGGRAAQLCNLGYYPSVMRTCYWNVGTIMGTMSTTATERKRACDAITTRFRTACFEGAQTVRTVKT